MYKKNVNGGRRFLQYIRSFFPQKMLVKIEYRIKCRRKLNLKKPERFSEKIQYYKLYYRNPQLTKLAGKDTVREYLKEKELDFLLNDIYGVYDRYDDIEFKKLPMKFVIKLNTGSGLNMVVENKNSLNHKKLKKTINNWLKIKPRVFGSEWAYKNIKPKIVIEKYIEELTKEGISDYKFFCFNRNVKYLYVYTINSENKKVSSIFDKMVFYAEKLSKGIPQVRVDLYNINGRIVFGEMTFYSRGGYHNFVPDKFDYLLGEQFKMNEISKKELRCKL